ncbi:hypothetical protein [Pseudomonas sp. BMS12]|uniref:hypothetical protein n=1 Tax=Pseudomonas sp. BMS12 TaxID=1796033 RepID=UPI000A833F70|nr:hypothetical protein [Pseudomonas sp. BMS12]
MKTSTCATLLLAIAGLALGLLLTPRPQPQITLLTCPPAQGGCYFPPPSIGRLMP